MRQPSVYGRVSQISAIYLFLCVFYAILRCISFKIRVNFLIELLRIYKTMVLTSFFDFIQAPSMRISLILHLNFAHIKPQQPNPVILVTILGLTAIERGEYVNLSFGSQKHRKMCQKMVNLMINVNFSYLYSSIEENSIKILESLLMYLKNLHRLLYI